MVFMLLIVAGMLSSCGSGSGGGGGSAPTPPPPGTLSFTPTSESITVGSAGLISLNLDGSSGVTNLTVNVTTNNPNIANPTTTSCVLSTISRSCPITISALTLGTAIITASAPGYAPTTATITTVVNPVPGTLQFTVNPATVVVGNTVQATFSLVGSSAISNLNVSFNATNASATIAPTNCTLSSSPTSNSSCIITITGVSPGIVPITANATNYVPAHMDITVEPSAGNFAYITNGNNNSYTQCNMNSVTGIDPNHCNTITPSGAGALNSPYGIAINNGFAYITNSGNNSYTQCNIGANGIESNTCHTVSPTVGLNFPTGIAFNNGFAYIVDAGSSTHLYTQCSVSSSTGDIDSNTCVSSSNPSAGNMSFVALSGGYAYFSMSLGYIQCTVGLNGVLTCSGSQLLTIPSGAGAYNTPFGITVSNGLAYFIVFASPPYIAQCTVGTNGINNNANDCTFVTPTASGALNSPLGITINHGFAYIINSGNNSYTQCQINATGIEASTCTTTIPTGNGVLNSPTAIAFSE